MKNLLLSVLLISSLSAGAQNVVYTAPLYGKYVPPVDATLYKQALDEKQAQYDSNVAYLKRSIDVCSGTIDEIGNYNPTLAKRRANQLIQLCNEFSQNYDYGSQATMNWALKKLNALQGECSYSLMLEKKKKPQPNN